MLDRDAVLKIIDDAYEMRRQGDKAGLVSVWAPGATYRLAGNSELLAKLPKLPANAKSATGTLIDYFTFHDLKRVDAIVEGLRAAILWRVTMSVGDKTPVRTEMYDLVTLNDDGAIVSFVQFVDTAAMADLLS